MPVVERHEDAVVRHPRGLDDLDDLLLEAARRGRTDFSSTTTLHRPLQTASASASVGHALGGELRPDAAADVDRADPRGVVSQIFIGSPATFIRSLSWTTRTSPSADSWTSSST